MPVRNLTVRDEKWQDNGRSQPLDGFACFKRKVLLLIIKITPCEVILARYDLPSANQIARFCLITSAILG